MLKRHSSASKFVLILSIVLLVYGGLARAFDIYFFWESRWLGRNLLFVGLIMLLVERIKWLNLEAKSSIIEKFGIGLVGLIVIFQLVAFTLLQVNDASKVGSEYIFNDDYVNDNVGQVNSALCYSGFAFKMKFAGNTGGVATLIYLVKGKYSYIEMPVVLAYEDDEIGWKVVEILYEELDVFQFEYNDFN